MCCQSTRQIWFKPQSSCRLFSFCSRASLFVISAGFDKGIICEMRWEIITMSSVGRWLWGNLSNQVQQKWQMNKKGGENVPVIYWFNWREKLGISNSLKLIKIPKQQNTTGSPVCAVRSISGGKVIRCWATGSAGCVWHHGLHDAVLPSASSQIICTQPGRNRGWNIIPSFY